ncbi:RNA polymerase II-associated protein 1 [Condylostylus longicornis]|uniref:RNA polymerase II-associated protein 1 n=1 Tax=Condylostylus longicornis TaxID=2530218 RepID=UPI00244E2CB5|nr:RNA polymerase II-associated protein 1 [Condylostylus longicornis]
MERPKRTDTEDDVLEMQNKFLSLKSKGTAFKPAAQVVKMGKEKKQSIFSQKRKKSEHTDDNKAYNYEPVPKNISLGEVVEKNDPSLSKKNNWIIGNIIEKPSVQPMDFEDCYQTDSAFPEIEKLESYDMPIVPGKSLFLLSMEKKNNPEKSFLAQACKDTKVQGNIFGDKSNIVKDQETGMSVHEENVNILSKMSEEEIREERENLLKCIDSNVLEFIKSQKRKLNPDANACVEAVKAVIKNSKQSFDTVSGDSSFDKQTNTKTNNISEIEIDNISNFVEEIPTVMDILKASESENWVNFNIIEKEKFEWMKNIPDMINNIKPADPFEARFDWKGVLLPYLEKDNNKDDRDLYMHGNESFRPGYTLQELFRLARSNIIQQKCSAFGSIYGILNFYNQGFYDNVLELPLTKIFFLLRYGADENTVSLLEIVYKGLSTLFYNETDETVLDFIFETSEGFLQPIIENNKKTGTDDSEGVETDLKNMTLSKTPFCAKLNEEQNESKASMTDFELAENDMIDCLLRTNIIQRIYYILKTIRPENSTTISCFKILIRLARTNQDVAKKIVSHKELVQLLIENFMPILQQLDVQSEPKFYNYPQHLVLKLIRIIISQHISLCINLESLDLINKIKSYLYTRDDIKGPIIKVQTESLRIIRVIMNIKPDKDFYKSLLPAFRYMLEWHYQHAQYEAEGPFLIRQHASALLAAVMSRPSYEAKDSLTDIIVMCCSKWFYTAKQSGIKDFSQSNLLSSCISCVNWYLKYNDKGFDEFIEKYLKPFICSKTFIEFQGTLEHSSIVLKYNSIDRRNVHPPLPNFGTVLIHSSGPQLIISQCYPIYFLSNLFNLTETLFKKRNNVIMLNLLQVDIIQIFVNYLKKISSKVNKKLATNFITKSEITLIYKLICFEGFHEFLDKTELLQASFNLISCMSVEHITEIETLFNLFIFNSKYLNFENRSLENWKQVYLETFIYPHSIIISPTDISLCLPCFPEPILPCDWPYMLLKSLLNKYLQNPLTEVVEKESEFPESEIVRITLTFTNVLEKNGVKIISPTEKLMYLMIAFMGKDSIFLEPDMKSQLKDYINDFFKMNLHTNFNFGGTFEGKSKFENLYVLFLDHFQAASYGDDLFSSLVMIPLAQKYDNKWRKMVWSEHASVLRFLNCKEDQLLGSLQAYLEPEESDISLIKCYSRALNSDLLRENTIPHKIATHHFLHYKNKKGLIT